jgi:hypothetical protein
MKAWSAISAIALIGITAGNFAAASYYFVLEARIKRTQPRQQVAVEGGFPEFSGLDIQGSEWAPRDAPCRVIRISDDGCVYCRKDMPAYERFLDVARRASCEVIEMSPIAGGIAYDPRPGVVQVKFVDADLGSVLFPFATPQTLVLDRKWSVRMNRLGAFDDKSLSAGITLLESFSESPAGQ